MLSKIYQIFKVKEETEFEKNQIKIKNLINDKKVFKEKTNKVFSEKLYKDIKKDKPLRVMFGKIDNYWFLMLKHYMYYDIKSNLKLNEFKIYWLNEKDKDYFLSFFINDLAHDTFIYWYYEFQYLFNLNTKKYLKSFYYKIKLDYIKKQIFKKAKNKYKKERNYLMYYSCLLSIAIWLWPNDKKKFVWPEIIVKSFLDYWYYYWYLKLEFQNVYILKDINKIRLIR